MAVPPALSIDRDPFPFENMSLERRPDQALTQCPGRTCGDEEESGEKRREMKSKGSKTRQGKNQCLAARRWEPHLR